MSSNLIEARGLGVRDGKRRILYDVEMALRAGEVVTIVGPNGAGKTTLLRALVGALKPSEGEVWRRPRLRIGYTPQKLAIDPTLPLTVDRFVALGSGASRAARHAALETVGIPELAGAQVAELSGGELQRAALARALLREPELLALDEPTQGLDQPGEAAFYRLIDRVRRQIGAAVCMVSHDLHVVMGASDRVICLNGHVCCEGAPLHVTATPEYRALFGLGTQGALALYRHEHDHTHGHGHDESHGAGASEPNRSLDHGHAHAGTRGAQP